MQAASLMMHTDDVLHGCLKTELEIITKQDRDRKANGTNEIKTTAADSLPYQLPPN